MPIFLLPPMDFGSPTPRPNFVSQGWGEPRTFAGITHEGMDFPLPIGTPIFAIADGVVINSVEAPEATSGNYVAVRHVNGWVSRYMHLSERLVKKGEQVAKGDLIAKSGNSGIRSSGAHLHFDVRMLPKFLSQYQTRYGEPKGGFGRKLSEGIGVPAEAVIPIDRYSSVVLKRTKKLGIKLFGQL